MSRIDAIDIFLSNKSELLRLFSDPFIILINWFAIMISTGNINVPIFLEMLKSCFDIEHASAIVLLFVVFHIFAHPFNELRKRAQFRQWHMKEFTSAELKPYNELTILEGVVGPFDEEARRNIPCNILRDGANPANTREIDVIQRFLEENTRYLHEDMDRSWGVARVGNSFTATAGMGRALQAASIDNNNTPPNAILGDISHRSASSSTSSGQSPSNTVETGESDDLIPAMIVNAMLRQFANNNQEVVKKRKERFKERDKEREKHKKEKESETRENWRSNYRLQFNLSYCKLALLLLLRVPWLQLCRLVYLQPLPHLLLLLLFLLLPHPPLPQCHPFSHRPCLQLLFPQAQLHRPLLLPLVPLFLRLLCLLQHHLFKSKEDIGIMFTKHTDTKRK
jgi:hypothetical protein